MVGTAPLPSLAGLMRGARRIAAGMLLACTASPIDAQHGEGNVVAAAGKALGKSRRLGVTASQPIDDAFFALFERLRAGRLIPKNGAARTQSRPFTAAYAVSETGRLFSNNLVHDQGPFDVVKDCSDPRMTSRSSDEAP